METAANSPTEICSDKICVNQAANKSGGPIFFIYLPLVETGFTANISITIQAPVKSIIYTADPRCTKSKVQRG